MCCLLLTSLRVISSGISQHLSFCGYLSAGVVAISRLVHASHPAIRLSPCCIAQMCSPARHTDRLGHTRHTGTQPSNTVPVGFPKIKSLRCKMQLPSSGMGCMGRGTGCLVFSLVWVVVRVALSFPWYGLWNGLPCLILGVVFSFFPISSPVPLWGPWLNDSPLNLVLPQKHHTGRRAFVRAAHVRAARHRALVAWHPCLMMIMMMMQ